MSLAPTVPSKPTLRPDNIIHLHISFADAEINIYPGTPRIIDSSSEDFFKPIYLLDFKVRSVCSIISVGVLRIEFTSEEARVEWEPLLGKTKKVWPNVEHASSLRQCNINFQKCSISQVALNSGVPFLVNNSPCIHQIYREERGPRASEGNRWSPSDCHNGWRRFVLVLVVVSIFNWQTGELKGFVRKANQDAWSERSVTPGATAAKSSVERQVTVLRVRGK